MVTDLTKEHPNKTLWRFLLPMLFSVMFQQIYNIADSMIAGRFAGENALAAVGASYPITIIFMAFAVGMNLGASVVVSRLFGAEDRGGVKRAVTTAFLSSMVLGIILTLFGYFFNHQMTIAENIAFGLKIKGKSQNYINDKIRYALKLVNLEVFENFVGQKTRFFAVYFA